jgi:hypothetical protein
MLLGPHACLHNILHKLDISRRLLLCLGMDESRQVYDRKVWTIRLIYLDAQEIFSGRLTKTSNSYSSLRIFNRVRKRVEVVKRLTESSRHMHLF